MTVPRFAPLALNNGWVVYDQLTHEIVNGVYAYESGAFECPKSYNAGWGAPDMCPLPLALGISEKTYERLEGATE